MTEHVSMPEGGTVNVILEITADQINKALAAAVTGSAIGEAVRKEIERIIQSMAGYNGIISKAVEQEANRQVVRVVQEKFAERIHAEVVERLTEEMVSDVVSRAWDRVHQAMR